MVKTRLEHDSSYPKINVFASKLAELLKFRTSFHVLDHLSASEFGHKDFCVN